MTTTTAPSAQARAAGRIAEPVPAVVDRRQGGIAVWATIGVVLTVFTVTVWTLWVVTGDGFGPVPALGPDKMASWRVVVMPIVEVLCTLGVLVNAYLVIVRPLRRGEPLGLWAKLFAAGLVSPITDALCFVTGNESTWAYNAHAFNLGSWISFMPFAPHLHRIYGEPPAVLAAYILFPCATAWWGTKLVTGMRRRWPNISNVTAYTVAFIEFSIMDFFLEYGYMLSGQFYSFRRVIGSVSFFAGTWYQFPIYCPLTVAAGGILCTSLMVSSQDSPDGLSWAERGMHRMPARLRQPASWFAIIGVAVTMVQIVFFFLPFNFLDMIGNSVAHVPSFLLPSGKP